MRKHVCRAVLAAVCAIVLCFPARAAERRTIFVAGNPDLYPVEYYDSAAKTFRGMMPDLYALLSERTGYIFTYINGGTLNGQERMAKNGQAEILSAHFAGDIDPQYVTASQVILTMDVDGQEMSILLAFSEIATEQLINDVTQALNGIPPEQRLTLLASHMMAESPNSRHTLWIILLSVLSLLLTAGLIILLVLNRKNHRADQVNSMIDERYGIGNDQYYLYCFTSLISSKSKSLYYLAYIAFDEPAFCRQYGADEGKNVHRYTAELLNRQAGAVDYLALIQDGVFLLLFQSNNKEEAERRTRNTIDQLNSYLREFKPEYASLFRAGVCVLEENPGCDAEAAFYTAKQGYLRAEENGTDYVFATKSLVAETQRSERLNQQILQALKDGEFQIYLQYIVDRTGRLFGAEAVSRWYHPREGLLYPGQYLKMINQSDTMAQHDFYMFEQVCKQLEDWRASGHGELRISCNFTRYTFNSPDFVDRVNAILEGFNFHHRNLIIEITEDLLSGDHVFLQENIEKCRALGICVALDDMGSGYSSLRDLSEYPLDLVKVDREMLLHAETPRGAMLLRGMIQLAHSMQLRVLCEGVETPEQNQLVLDAGCDYIQGFYYSRTLPQREAKRFLLDYCAR